MNLDEVSVELKKNITPILIDALLEAYKEVKENFYLEKFEPSELNGGKMVEACVRILEILTGAATHTPLGANQIRNMIQKLQSFEQKDATLYHESYRLHIPRVLISIYNLRNRRGVGHLAHDVKSNIMDAIYILNACNWVLAELLRLNHTITLDEAQRTVDALVERPDLSVYKFKNLSRSLKTNLTRKEQVLLILASHHPNVLTDEYLFKSIEPPNKANFKRDVLKLLHSERLIEYDNENNCMILPNGFKYIESNKSKFYS